PVASNEDGREAAASHLHCPRVALAGQDGVGPESWPGGNWRGNSEPRHRTGRVARHPDIATWMIRVDGVRLLQPHTAPEPADVGDEQALTRFAEAALGAQEPRRRGWHPAVDHGPDVRGGEDHDPAVRIGP